MSHWMKCNNTFLSIQEFFLYNINFIDSITHVVYSILEMCYYAFTNVIENIFMNRLIPNNSLYLQLEIIFKV